MKGDAHYRRDLNLVVVDDTGGELASMKGDAQEHRDGMPRNLLQAVIAP